jgi:hypothetical protein
MFTALAWFVLAIAVGMFASTRGREGLGWFFLAIVISPLLAFILCAILAPKNAYVEELAQVSLQAQVMVEALEAARKAEARIWPDVPRATSPGERR